MESRSSIGRRTSEEPRPAHAVIDLTEDEKYKFNVIVGGAIRRARKGHGWTQAFLAEQADLSPNYIARLERGELGPSLFVANKLAAALEIGLSELVQP